VSRIRIANGSGDDWHDQGSSAAASTKKGPRHAGLGGSIVVGVSATEAAKSAFRLFGLNRREVSEATRAKLSAATKAAAERNRVEL
jgi:hypothetical protein